MKEIVFELLHSHLINISSCVDMLCLHFEKCNHLYCLHVQSDWQFLNGFDIILCRNDMYMNENGEYFNTKLEKKKKNASLFAYKSRDILISEKLPMEVIEVNLLIKNGLKIKFKNGYDFCISFDDDTSCEMWRFFEKGNFDKNHLVAYSTMLCLE